MASAIVGVFKAKTIIRWGLALASGLGLAGACAFLAPIGFVVMLATLTQTNESVCAIHNAAGDGALVVSPLAAGSYSVGDPFGMRVHPITGVLGMHWGQDFPAAAGTPIYAIAAGTVVDVHAGPTGANWVEIEHRLPDGEIAFSLYMHSEQDGIFVHVGQFVLAGQHIADVGASGMVEGPHLHLEIRVATAGLWTTTGRQNPVPWLVGHGAISVESC